MAKVSQAATPFTPWQPSGDFGDVSIPTYTLVIEC